MLTSSAYMYAGTGDPRWRTRYWANDPLLSQALRELSMFSPLVYRDHGGEMVSKANDELVALEERSMEAASRGDRGAALGTLDSEEYQGLKRRYSAGMEQINSALRADLGKSADEQYRGLWSLVCMSVGAVLLAGGWCVWLVSQTHKRALRLAYSMTLTVRQSEREARKLALVTSRTDNAVFITDAAGRIEWVNDAFVRLNGESLDNVRGANVLPMYRCEGEEGDGSATLEACVGQGRGYRGELVCRTASGRRYWAALELEPIRDDLGCVVQFFAIQRDITARREASERLAKSNAEILEANGTLEEQARRLEAQALELDRARQDAEAASRAKSEFLANMSHEIRTPLNGVIGALELLERSGLESRQERFCGMARTSGAALLSLINDILDCSKLDAGAVELESIDFSLGTLCAEITDMFAQRVEEKGISLSCEVSPALPRSLKGDPTRLRQVLLNLVSNAIKFTHQGGVVLRVTPERRLGERIEVRVTISDSGIGIPQDRVDRLFKSFSQVDASTTRRYGGTGLGLSICKSLVTLMGGEIGVASEEGRGSTFFVTVPLGLGAGAGTGSSEAAGDWRIQDMRVLALSEGDAERDEIETLLESWGFRHEVGRPDEAAIHALIAGAAAGKPVDLVLLSADSAGAAMEFSLRITSDPRL
ncbi:MAG: PAS domain S-box protein, partial [Phycisphaerales bacterium]|nr:PAS domain S-box protein [Phycisphaerales bacterium]